MNNPQISVVMPVYNTKIDYLKASIESILNQTYKDFEFIIIDDGSHLEVKSYLNTFIDERIVVISNETNRGVAACLNDGIRIAKGKYIARMDSDDISTADRLFFQKEYLDNNEDVVVLGGVARTINEDIYMGYYPKQSQKKIKTDLLFNNIPIIHPTTMIRASVLRRNNILYSESVSAEDYELWTRLIDYGKIEVLPRVLLFYRFHELQVTSANKQKINDSTNMIRKKQMGPDFDMTDLEEKLFYDIREYRCEGNVYQLNCLIKKMMRINIKNTYFRQSLLMYWIIIVKKISLMEMLKYGITYTMLKPSNLVYIINDKIINKYKIASVYRVLKKGI